MKKYRIIFGLVSALILTIIILKVGFPNLPQLFRNGDAIGCLFRAAAFIIFICLLGKLLARCVRATSIILGYIFATVVFAFLAYCFTLNVSIGDVVKSIF